MKKNIKGIFEPATKNVIALYLLQLRTDSNSWGIPGGCLNIGESLEDAAKREVIDMYF